MEHVVFSAADGGTGEEFRRVSSLEEAVRVVEHLRNDLGVTDSSVYALTPVPVAFRTYYRVEFPGAPLVVESAAFELPVLEPTVAITPIAVMPAVMPAAVPQLAPSPVEELAAAEPTDVEVLADSVFAGPEFGEAKSADVPLAASLPPASAIPPSRHDGDAERSLGYFAR